MLTMRFVLHLHFMRLALVISIHWLDSSEPVGYSCIWLPLEALLILGQNTEGGRGVIGSWKGDIIVNKRLKGNHCGVGDKVRIVLHYFEEVVVLRANGRGVLINRGT